MPAICFDIKGLLRLLSASALLLVSFQTMAQKNELHGDATTYVGFAPPKQFSGLGYASLYNTKNFWQVRYNYEDVNTLSFLWGKPLTKENKNFSFQAVPTIGVSVGNFIGFSPALQMTAEAGHFEFYSSNQYSLCANKLDESFFFTWSEALYTVQEHIKVGAAFQYLKKCPVRNNNELAKAPQQIDFGPMVGVEYKKFYLSGYFFNLWSPQRHYAVSLTYNFK